MRNKRKKEEIKKERKKKEIKKKERKKEKKIYPNPHQDVPSKHIRR